MADYYPLLSRAVAGKSAEERRAIFERAQGALERQLRGFDPPLEEAAIRQELEALSAVIAVIERELAPADDPPAAVPPVDPEPVRSMAPEPPSAPRPAVPPPPSPVERPAREPVAAEPPVAEASEPEPAPKLPEGSEPSDDEPAAATAEAAPVRPTLRPRLPARGKEQPSHKRVALFAGLAVAAMLVMGSSP
jgi:hypothetical protein